MPDFIDNHIFVSGSETDLRAFRQRHFVTNRRTGRLEFDFESFLPIPDLLRDIAADSESDLALIALGVERGRSADPYALTLDRVLRFDRMKAAGIRSRDELLAYLEEHAPRAVSAARQSIAAFRETGYYDGHAWRLANWGIKWGPTSTQIIAGGSELLEFRFETAWGFPEPAFRRLGLIYPDLRFDIAAVNPDLDVGIEGHVLGSEVSLAPMSIVDGCAGTFSFDDWSRERLPT